MDIDTHYLYKSMLILLSPQTKQLHIFGKGVNCWTVLGTFIINACLGVKHASKYKPLTAVLTLKRQAWEIFRLFCCVCERTETAQSLGDDIHSVVTRPTWA